MIREHIHSLDKTVGVVRYDAWKYGGKDLKRNFIASVAADLDIKDPQFGEHLHRNAEEVKLRLGYWLRTNWDSLALGLAVAALCALAVVAVGAAVRIWLTDTTWREAVVDSGPGALPVFGLVFAALVIGQKVLEGAVEKIVLAPPEGDDQFSAKFRDLLKSAKATDDHPLVVFIDELDRCAEEDVVSTLVDLKTFLDQKGCVFVVAVDRDVVEQALDKVPQSKPVRGADPYYSTRGAFLDKIFQHQIALPPLRPKVLTRLARDLVASADGLWKELRDHDEQTFDYVVFALVPAHLSSPRRVKVLLNAYATNVRIAQERGIEWLDRAAEIAVLTVIQTEFPAVAGDLVRAPQLLAAIRGGLTGGSEDLLVLAERYQVGRLSDDSDDKPAAANPTGELLADEDDDSDVVVARDTSARHLSDYLAKIAAAGLGDPRPDLYYLQPAGLAEGLIEKRHSDAIDQSTNTAPERTVRVFEDEPPETLRVAVNLLVAEGERDFGPGRLFAYEAACLLVERIDPIDIARLDRTVPGAILAAVGESGWQLSAIPGALLLASQMAQDHSIDRLLHQLQVLDVDAEVLTRASRALQTGSDGFTRKLAPLFADRYAESPEPLHSALSTLSSDAAERLWDAVDDNVMKTIARLELPAPQDSPPAQTGRAVRAATQAVPVPTGDGRKRLVALIEALLGRTDGEELLSTVLQRSLELTDVTLLDQVEDLAPRVLAAMEDSTLVNRSVFTGLGISRSSGWQRWTSLLRPPVSNASVARSAGDVMAGVLLSQLTEAAVDDLKLVQQSAKAIAPHCNTAEVGEGITSRLEQTMEAVRWHSDLEDSDWNRRRVAAWDVATTLRSIVGSATMDRLLVDDVCVPVKAQELDAAAVDELMSRIDALERGPADTVSQALDAYSAPKEESLAVLRLRLRARSRCDGPPVDTSELVHLDDSVGATSAFEDWLSLGPDGEAVAGQLQHVSPARPPLDSWAKYATDADRTRVWIALVGTHATIGLLRAVGQYGITANVVAHTEQRVREGTNQADRNGSFDVLETARLSTAAGSGIEKARRTASELAETLLGSGYQGDARLALRVVTWAGGPGRGHATTLRKLFDEARVRHQGLFTKQEKNDLERLNLLTKRRVLDKLRGK